MATSFSHDRTFQEISPLTTFFMVAFHLGAAHAFGSMLQNYSQVRSIRNSFPKPRDLILVTRKVLTSEGTS
jgi:hypothetical protein